jgi:hypothetical protein
MPKVLVASKKLFNPYDLNEVAEVEKIVEKRPFRETEKNNNHNTQKNKIKRGILKLDSDNDRQ